MKRCRPIAEAQVNPSSMICAAEPVGDAAFEDFTGVGAQLFHGSIVGKIDQDSIINSLPGASVKRSWQVLLLQSCLKSVNREIKTN
jgi:hypothetical protein